MATETPTESSVSATRPPVYLPTYSISDEGQPGHFLASTSRETAAIEARLLAVGDAAFIKRSDLKWTYAVVSERVTANEGTATILRFEVDQDRNRKSFPEAQWGKYIRVVKVEESELARLKVEAEGAAAKKSEEEVPKTEEEAAKSEEAPKDDASKASAEPEKKEEDSASGAPEVASSAASTGGESAKSKGSKMSAGGKSAGGSSWFSGLFAKKPEDDGKPSLASSVVSEEKEEEEATKAVAVEGETPIVIPEHAGGEPMKEDPAAAALAATSFPSFAEHISASKEEAEAAAPAPEAAPEAAKEEPDNTKENSDPIRQFTQPPVFLPSPKAVSSVQGSKSTMASATTASSGTSVASKLKNPLSLKRKGSIVNKLFSKNKDKSSNNSTSSNIEPVKTVTMQLAPLPTAVAAATNNPNSPKLGEKKEWFDPEACEVDYDKNPTDLFQALEARQFEYADEMYKQVNAQFTKECKTWVVARGQKKKDSQLRFRALPLHAALVFGATDEMTIKILNSYPKATRGRDVKGRLPIHLAMEHDASEQVVAAILEAFPKGFFAKDKKDMTPLDYVNNNMARAHMKRYVPLLTAAKVEDERTKWELEKEESLQAQRAALKTDPVYMEDVIEKVTDEVETAYATKMELLETNYKKEIQLLKKRHDSETQALLEGFEVKLNFERKLMKLKGKA